MLYTVGLTSTMGIYAEPTTLAGEINLAEQQVVLFTHVRTEDEESAVRVAIVPLVTAREQGRTGFIFVSDEWNIPPQKTAADYIEQMRQAMWRVFILEAVVICDGNVSNAARMLKCSHKQFYKYLTPNDYENIRERIERNFPEKPITSYCLQDTTFVKPQRGGRR
jgi:hypothetical protein